MKKIPEFWGQIGVKVPTISIVADPVYQNICRQVSLTPREQQLLHLLTYGYDLADIASQMQLTVGTVKGYIQ